MRSLVVPWVTPISTLSKIFVEKFEDNKLLVYTCKYEHNRCCNTRFTDVKENPISRLENLIRCHLLEHLTKTKAGDYRIVRSKSNNLSEL
jgi:hypothetical protein